MFGIFNKKPTSYLGVDIGTASIKAVELRLSDGKVVLDNYALLETKNYVEILNNAKKFDEKKETSIEVARDLEKIISEAGINSKNIVMSIPTSSAFSSVIDLPDIPDEEIGRAVSFEARQYIPIPIEEVVFDWNVIGRKTKNNESNISSSKQSTNIKVLLVAIPKEITAKYTSIAKVLKLNLVALETESFSLSRSLVGKKEEASVIIDIGSKTTSITLVENGSILTGHSVSGTGGDEITKIISRGVNIDFNRAESLKKDVGITSLGPNKKISEMLIPVASIIVSEARRVGDVYSHDNQKEIKKVILTGGTAKLPGLLDYFSRQLSYTVEIGNPWKNIEHNQILDKKLEEMSPYFSVATGLALRGFESQLSI